MPRIARAALTTDQYQALLVGLPKYCPNAVFVIGGQSYTTAQVVALITSILQASLAVPPAKATWLEAATQSRELEAEDGETVKEVREVVALMFKNAASTLAELAIAPRKSPTPLSAEARVAANAKAKATRIARGTTSRKQKAQIHGNVSGVTITPNIEPSTAPAATPPVVVGPVVTGTAASGSTPHA